MTALRFHLYHILSYINPRTEGPQELAHFNKVTTYISQTLGLPLHCEQRSVKDPVAYCLVGHDTVWSVRLLSRFGGMHWLEDGSSLLLQNVVSNLLEYTVLHSSNLCRHQ
jgi:hypothetical protein